MIEVKLKDLLTINNGSDYKKEPNGDIPVYGTGGEMCRIGSYMYDGESILLPRKGSLSNIMYVKGKFWTVDTMYWTRVNTAKVSAKYLYYYLSLLDLSCRDSGSTLPSMTFSAYYDLDLDIHSISEQENIVRVIDAIDRKIEINRQINDNLAYSMVA